LAFYADIKGTSGSFVGNKYYQWYNREQDGWAVEYVLAGEPAIGLEKNCLPVLF